MMSKIRKANDMSNPFVGSSLDDFLEAEGINDEVTLDALRHVLAWMLKEKHPVTRHSDQKVQPDRQNPPPNAERHWDGS